MPYSEYTLSFEMTLKGVSIEGSVANALLSLFKTHYSSLQELIFTSIEDGDHSHTIINGTTHTLIPDPDIEALQDGYQFITRFCNLLEKVILINMVPPAYGNIPSLQQVEALQISAKTQSGAQIPRLYPSNIMFKLMENLKLQIEVSGIERTLSNMCISAPSPSQQIILDATNTAAFWLSGANEVGEGKGLTFFNLVSKFRLLWTAFNALYNQEGVHGEKNQIKSYIKNRTYADTLLADYFLKNKTPIQQLADSSLTLKSGQTQINISDELKYHIDMFEGQTPAVGITPVLSSTLQEAVMLALYAVRNPIFHGNNDKQPLELMRECIDILDTLIKTCIREEIASL